MDTEKAKERIKLRGNQQTTVAIGFARGGKSKIEPGDKIAVASTAVSVLSARFNPETGLVDVVPVHGALGDSDVHVGITLADGTVLPPQAVQYTVVHPDAEAVTLAPGAIGDKKTIITNPVPNADPHVVPEPKKKQDTAAHAPPVGTAPGVAKTGAPSDPPKTTGTFQVDRV